MKSFVGALLLVVCTLPFIQADGLTDINTCVTIHNGTSSTYIDQSYRHLSEKIINFRIHVHKSHDIWWFTSDIVGSKLSVCDELPPQVHLSDDDQNYIVLRDENSSDKGYYELTVYYDDNVL